MSRRWAGILTGWLTCCTGCQSYFADPWKVDPTQVANVDSPSTARLRALEGRRSALQREAPRKRVALASTTVAHAPLYFEDPFEAFCCEDDGYRWTLLDIGATFYSGARWLVNSVAIPVSAVVYPPCSTVETDAAPVGRPDRVAGTESCCGTCIAACRGKGCCRMTSVTTAAIQKDARTSAPGDGDSTSP